MTIKIHRARAHRPPMKSVPEFHSQSRERAASRLAAACVVAWNRHLWPGGCPPPIPRDPDAIISTYFWGTPGGEGPWVEWAEIEIDLAPDFGAPVEIRAGGYSLSVEKVPSDPPGIPGFVIAGDLFQDEGLVGPSDELQAAGDAIESLVLCLASAGFPIHLPEFAEALESSLDAIVNNID